MNKKSALMTLISASLLAVSVAPGFAKDRPQPPQNDDCRSVYVDRHGNEVSKKKADRRETRCAPNHHSQQNQGKKNGRNGPPPHDQAGRGPHGRPGEHQGNERHPMPQPPRADGRHDGKGDARHDPRKAPQARHDAKPGGKADAKSQDRCGPQPAGQKNGRASAPCQPKR